jgi:hypothetical protein
VNRIGKSRQSDSGIYWAKGLSKAGSSAGGAHIRVSGFSLSIIRRQTNSSLCDLLRMWLFLQQPESAKHQGLPLVSLLRIPK